MCSPTTLPWSTAVGHASAQRGVHEEVDEAVGDDGEVNVTRVACTHMTITHRHTQARWPHTRGMPGLLLRDRWTDWRRGRGRGGQQAGERAHALTNVGQPPVDEVDGLQDQHKEEIVHEQGLG
jgi:hypothetical protein